jgi:hypothetical protein
MLGKSAHFAPETSVRSFLIFPLTLIGGRQILDVDLDEDDPLLGITKPGRRG